MCRKSGEAVFITKNGVGNLVVMSVGAYERDQARLRLYELLDAAEEDERRGDKGLSLKSLGTLLRKDMR
jgi:PHD/YefM family antitoxin component YafN of YafNO toxin-antitoxin module